MEKHFPTTRTARYQQLGELTPATRHLWLVLHGYGQLVEYFIRHFAPLHAADPAGTVVVAPEALSRFYLSGNGGRVGASWMTRADRLTEIADQQAYLTTLLAALRAAAPTAAVTVLGFSQGTATASRWLSQLATTTDWRPSRLVLWAGDFPADALPAAVLLPGLPVAMVYGTRDAYISQAQFQQQAAALEQHGAVVGRHSFAGGHTLDASVLHTLAG